jgi:hypothetical protein
VVYIWIRRTVAWEREDEALAAVTDPWIAEKARTWNATFNMSFQRFRLRVAQIAERNHAGVAGAIRAEWDDIPDGALVLPVDDDDWFAPDAAHRLEAVAREGPSAFLWRAEWVEVPLTLGHRWHSFRRRHQPSLLDKFTCSTNNYAMIKSDEFKLLLDRHTQASRWFDEHLQVTPGPIARVAGHLSVANRTLASQTTLGLATNQISRRELMRKYRRHRRLYRRPVPGGVAWCRPYVDMMAALMAELEPTSPSAPA